jgi:DNA-binding NtrC family response regulator
MSALPLPQLPFDYSGGAVIASPNLALREQLTRKLDGRCRPVQHTLGGAEALAHLERGDWRVLFLDRRVPDLDAEELRTLVEHRFPAIEVVLFDSESEDNPASPGSPPSADRRAGLVGAESAPAISSAAPGEAERDLPKPLVGMIGTSEAMQRVYRLVRLVAPRLTTVLVAGPTGTGKELVARALHSLSPRASRPFVVVNCAAIPETLLESELFGYNRGAFTGAVQGQMGRIPAAQGGTLFLDEVSELPLGMQAKLLRFLEQKEIQRLGATEVMRVDVRVVAASNVDLAGRAGRGEFREDLYYRLSAFPVELPPLAERRSDIIPLAEHFLACMAAAMEAPPPRLSADAAQILEAHAWRGNVRELQHVMERASILAGNEPSLAAEHIYFSSPFNHPCCRN